MRWTSDSDVKLPMYNDAEIHDNDTVSQHNKYGQPHQQMKTRMEQSSSMVMRNAKSFWELPCRRALVFKGS